MALDELDDDPIPPEVSNVDSDEESVGELDEPLWLNRRRNVDDLLDDMFVSDFEDDWGEEVEFGEVRRFSDDEAD